MNKQKKTNIAKLLETYTETSDTFIETPSCITVSTLPLTETEEVNKNN